MGEYDDYGRGFDAGKESAADENEQLRAALDNERANAEDLRQNCTRVVEENERLRATARTFLDEQTAENAQALREALEQSVGQEVLQK